MSDRPVEPPYNPHYFPQFDPPYPSRTFDDVMYAVSGRNRAENHLITIARDEFFLYWCTDERMAARLQTWSASIGLPEIINDIAAFLDRVADRYGLSRRGDLGRIPRPPHISVEDLLPEWYGLQDCLYAAYRRSSEVRDAVCTYVDDELQQPWPWLAYRLTDHIFQQAWERAEGITMIRQRTSHLDPMWEPRVQPFRFVFETKLHETVAEAKQRLMAEARAFCRNIHASKEEKFRNLPKGSPRKNQQENAIQDARWLYRQLICGATPAEIVTSHHEERRKSGKHTQDLSDACGCWQRVGRGLRNAMSLLDATPFYFSGTDK